MDGLFYYFTFHKGFFVNFIGAGLKLKANWD